MKDDFKPADNLRYAAGLDDYNWGNSTIQHINEFARKQNDLILSIYQKQEGFISLEESKEHIEVHRIESIYRGYLGTDYYFKGKKILTIYPLDDNSHETNTYKFSFNYREY